MCSFAQMSHGRAMMTAMPRPPLDTRDGKRFCPGRPTTHAPKRIALEHWHRWTEKTSNGSVARYAPVCQACEIHDRTEAKGQDPARAKVERAAEKVVGEVNKFYRTIGSEERISKDFVMRRLHYNHLIEPMRFALTSNHCWSSCGEPYKNERDIQLEHREPPRSPTDWERMDARNIDVKCGTCNNKKDNMPYAQWLHEQWEMYDKHYEDPETVPESWVWQPVSRTDWLRPSNADVPLL
jgi:hypothetical protein